MSPPRPIHARSAALGVDDNLDGETLRERWQAGIDARLAAARGRGWTPVPTRLDRMLLALRGGR